MSVGQKVAAQARNKALALQVLRRAGVIRPYGPVKLANLARVMVTFGLGCAGAFQSAATRFPDRTAVIDEDGSWTFAELDAQSNAFADSLAASGVKAGDGVGLLARNHVGFVIAAVGITKLGANVLLLNTAFAGPQLAEVCTREEAKWLIYDEEFAGLVDNSGLDIPRAISYGSVADVPTLASLVASGSRARRRPPAEVGKTIILTSGTTGTPKGAPRGAAHLDVPVGMLERIPLRSGWRTHVAAPLFHFWGLGQWMLGLMLGNTAVLTRKFDPEDFLATLAKHNCDAGVVVPVMLQRVLALDEDVKRKYHLPNLKVIAASGSALPGNLATEWMDAFGDNLYNTYGSTEVSLVSIATPQDMRRSPGTSGRPAATTTVKLLDEAGKPVGAGKTGRIFAGNSMLFEGYTGGGSKEQVDGLMSTGDVGYLDAEGRLHVEGRDDEMIVSGGENVFPKEVEDCIAAREEVVEVAAVGIDDAEFGKRLKAFVVLAPGASVTAPELAEHVKANLARYKVPKEFVFIDELPRNATGKVLKRALLED